MNRRKCFITKKIFLFAVSILFLSSNLIYAADADLLVSNAIKKINQGMADEAVPLLENALKLAPDDLEAVYYAGLAYSRTGKYDRAEKMFLKALDLDDTAVYAHLELGQIYYIRSQCSRMESHLAKFISLSDDQESKEFASRLMGACSKENADDEDKPYRLNISVGAQYDSNVILEPSNPVSDADRKNDWRGLVYLAAGATVLEKAKAKADIDYSFYQSLHSHLDAFDVHSHNINPSLKIALSDKVDSILGYSFDYSYLGREQYSRIHNFSAGINVKEGSQYATEGTYNYYDNKFWDSDMAPDNSIRSGSRHTFTLKQFFFYQRAAANIYGLFDHTRTGADYWDYTGYSLGGDINVILPLEVLPGPLNINAGFEYEEKNYKGNYPDTGLERFDMIQEYSVTLTYEIRKNMIITLSEGLTLNNSNIGDFDYTRSVTGLFFTVVLL